MRARSLVAGAVAIAAVAAAGLAALPASADQSGPVKPLIVGGKPSPEPYSFMVSLQNNGRHFCGGSLISPEWVITAAHCVEGASKIQLRIGSLQHASGGEEAESAEIIPHPDYNGSSPGGDIALVKLAAAAKSAPVAMAGKADPGTQSRIIGWGQTTPEPGGSAPDDLQELDTQVLDANKCTGIDGSVELCTDNPNGDSGACYGDSGGPQVAKEGEGWTLIGATSRSGNGDSTCATGPSIYTSVPAYADWIKQNTGGSVTVR
ncbi:trypsin [Herbihabitans rhizosphaerae]|uniref:Trypsin n=1 Tax=Herbihabitans rhizosphaerae TaxID=1872711 RepID=A0A4Q7L503_9PSEU|nr:serine protease [Herbihabitans rhizosphaerae]RZS44385.1 trypsin [Herbihabitans rhizosphaerae]